MDNVKRIYILLNWLGLRGLKNDSLIWVLDVFAIAFRIYPKGPLIQNYVDFQKYAKQLGGKIVNEPYICCKNSSF